MEMNEILHKLPKHLLSLVVEQPYHEYTAQDHELWRYVMRQNIHFLDGKSHGSYLEGLRKTGISINEIPHMYGMNRILKEIGWAAVAVDGFIPPSAFMEFQAYNVLVIAADIRPVGQIGYTPAPDIIHEAAGHAPIIADPEYAAYLKRFGEIGRKAFPSVNDNRIYEAIRHLSILKADPYSDPEQVRLANEQMDKLAKAGNPASELALLRNLHWWTVEYGLIGAIDCPKIYGAGLLSSIAESFYCLQPTVKKIPYSIAAAWQGFDITEPQPQLYVTPDFATLTEVLEIFADTMAWRRGGLYGVEMAIASENVATCEWAGGVQVSGIFTSVIGHDGQPVYVRTTGPTSLSVEGIELEGHSKRYHNLGFGSPVGKWKINEKSSGLHNGAPFSGRIPEPGEQVAIEFESGIFVKGKVERILHHDGKLQMITFSDCLVTYQEQTLFHPDWGMYDMAIGNLIVSAFPGPADPEAYEFSFPVPAEKTHKIQYTAEARQLHAIYEGMRTLRSGKATEELVSDLWRSLKTSFPDDWLCSVGLLETALVADVAYEVQAEILKVLNSLAIEKPSLAKLIADGLSLLYEKNSHPVGSA
ncbi:MAG TPA: aromatic amino acid hydroxylase [Bacteroidales bacterium]|nr:MAG: hypothetical protein A2X11_04445 [Bacteroidetes bacterium GWE2_42_24]OFY27662.1 MAG: hypothetical protein A2X09_10685 [Bacteroidetes bacterium GWF2_43_11]HAQ64379.1 aromatic amino acid hydroxylase [Bacteroidales bacterium]HBZ66508.1 aromatic amino acid hydroxylase [Bacteroidales bacterium]